MFTTISEKQNDVPLVFTLICFVEVSSFIYVICIYKRVLITNTISVSHVVLQ